MKKILKRVGIELGLLIPQESGAVSGNFMTMLMGIVLVAISFTIFPVVIEGAEESRTATNVTEYTGLQPMVEVGPTVAFAVLILGGAILTGYGGYRMARRR